MREDTEDVRQGVQRSGPERGLRRGSERGSEGAFSKPLFWTGRKVSDKTVKVRISGASLVSEESVKLGFSIGRVVQADGV